MRLGVFGGSFDPVHLGHLILAELCRETARLDCVRFIPAAVSPHKQTQRPTQAKIRLEMLELAISGHPDFEMSTREIERGGVSYTVDTLREIRRDLPDANLFFLMGADSLAEFGSWREPSEICALAVPLVVSRPGAPRPSWDAFAPFVSAERLAEFRSLQISMPQIDISSSDIRRRVNEGRSIRYQTPRAVEKYIETHGLYRAATPGKATS